MNRQFVNQNANNNEVGNTAKFISFIVAIMCNGVLLAKTTSVILSDMVSKNDMLILPLMGILSVVSISVAVHMFRKHK